MYTSLVRPLLFRLDAERAHHLTFHLLRGARLLPGMAALLRSRYDVPGSDLSREVFGLRFRNPLGLAAGLDKDGLLGSTWGDLGFGFVEFGTVTPRPQPGNPRRRLFRLPADRAIINRMGFNNAGADALAQRLGRMERGDLVVGANIGKNKDTPNEQAVADYLRCFERLYDLVDYFVVNVSSPNTPGLRALQDREPLTQLLDTLQQHNRSYTRPKPLLLKIAPDLEVAQLDDIVAVARETRLAGLVATNTTLSRAGLRTPADEVAAIGAGGLSGAPLTHRAGEVLRYLRQRLNTPLIGVGGIMTPTDAADRLADGADLIQVYSGFVYEGPAFARRILRSIKTVL
ncbi:MAG: quinone-dependent dihydroorotate dehydrogenase [Bacteroidia bacterium]